MQEIIVKRIEKAKEVFDRRGGLKAVYFVGCGGSWAASNVGKCLLARENRSGLAVEHLNSSEFVHATPGTVGENALVFVTSLNATEESVEALLLAKRRGAYAIAITGSAETRMAAAADDFCAYRHHENWTASFHNPAVALRFTAEILRQFEGFELYDALIASIDGADEIYREQEKLAAPLAIRFAFDNRDKEVFHVFGSGAMYGAAYTTANCYLIEMQQRDAVTMHSGEFFHGPFEAITPGSACILFMGAGATRPLDERVKRFLDRFSDCPTVIDGMEMVRGKVDERVADYIAPLIAMPVAKLYVAEMANQRLHPMSTRRYMWKFDY